MKNIGITGQLFSDLQTIANAFRGIAKLFDLSAWAIRAG